MNHEFYAMKPSFFGKWIAKREAVHRDAGLMDRVLQTQVDDLDAQYKRVWKVDGDTGTIIINGPLSPDGPDAIEVMMGYGGTAYKNIVKAAADARAAYDAEEIKQVRVVFNSPGGSLDGLDQAYQALTGIADIAIGYNAGDAASAAYWLATALPRLEPLTPTAAAGSIGVVATIQDWSGYLDQWGVKEVTITNTDSPNKRPDVLTPEGVEIIRKELDGYYDVFVDRVTATRPVTREAIDALKGEMLISKRAVAYGLMDAPLADTATADKTNNEFKGGVTMDTLKGEVTAQTADQIATAVATPEVKVDLKTERTRIMGLLKVSGSPVSAEVLTAIETGVDVGAYAVAKAEAEAASAAVKAAAEKAEVDAARALRETAAAQNISGIKAGNLPNTTDAKAEQVDKLVEKVLPKKKGGI